MFYEDTYVRGELLQKKHESPLSLSLYYIIFHLVSSIIL